MPKKSAILAALMAVLAGALFVAACNDAPSPTAPPPPAENVVAAPAGASLVAGAPGYAPQAGDPSVAGQPVPVLESKKGAGGCGGKKVAVCHVPPENPANVHEICISENAVPAHLGHGDNLFGEEVCDGVDNDCNGIVDDGGNALCDDDVSCTVDVCHGAAGCANTPDDSFCDNGLFCDGAETCDAVADCQAGAPPVTDDGVACTDDSCDETNGVVNAPNHAFCDDQLFCTGQETCDAQNGCKPGSGPCGVGYVCNETVDLCQPVPASCPCWTTQELLAIDGFSPNGEPIGSNCQYLPGEFDWVREISSQHWADAQACGATPPERLSGCCSYKEGGPDGLRLHRYGSVDAGTLSPAEADVCHAQLESYLSTFCWKSP